jgi:hypothetical protein
VPTRGALAAVLFGVVILAAFGHITVFLALLAGVAVFQRADMVADNPMVWILQVNGLAMDARTVPLGIQVEAFQRGLIPYIRLWAGTAQKLLAIRGKGTPPGASSHLPGPPDVRPATPRYPGRGRQVRPYPRALSVRWASV